ncbi:hypothetical protein KSS87_021422 [Heliosperma pusillum]|nr:hypothetical protein KSS87_021422 [Heliosperma pusillum]
MRVQDYVTMRLHMVGLVDGNGESDKESGEREGR